MSLDLANDDLNTSVCCSCVCADSYGCTNLINSRSQLLRRKGFQGERFVRVPVTIQFQFPIPANIHKVEFRPAIGRQCAKIIQLFSSNSYPVSSDVKRYERDWANNFQFRRCASVALTECAKVTFLNRGYSPHPGLPKTTDDTSSVTTFTSGNLSDVTALRITIRQMLIGSVPSITDLHIWGRPAKSCSRAQKNEILRLSMQSKQSTCEHQLASDMFYSSNMLSKADSDCATKILEAPKDREKNEESTTNSSDRIPGDMLDPLTLEVMRLPILLPSGHSVDRSTLDKHVKSQSEYGNAASDPFTGIPFSESNKPIPNVKLKARIDEFNLKELPKQAGSDKNPVHCTEHVASSESSPSVSVSDSKRFHSKVTNKRTYVTGHAGQLTASLEESLAEMGHSMSKRRSLASANEAPSSTLICCKCSAFMFSDSVRYIVPCKCVICGGCVKNIRERIQCPCLLTHELKSVRRTYREWT